MHRKCLYLTYIIYYDRRLLTKHYYEIHKVWDELKIIFNESDLLSDSYKTNQTS